MKMFRFCHFLANLLSLWTFLFFFLRITISISSSHLHQSLNSLSFPCSFQNMLKVNVPSVMCSASSSSSSSNRFCFPPYSVLPLAVKVIIGWNHGQPYYPHLSDNSDWDKGFYMAIAWPNRILLRDCHQAVGPKKLSLFTGTANPRLLIEMSSASGEGLCEITEDKTNI